MNDDPLGLLRKDDPLGLRGAEPEHPVAIPPSTLAERYQQGKFEVPKVPPTDAMKYGMGAIGGFVGGVPGGILGYGAGAELADLYSGTKKPGVPGLIQSAEHLKTGAEQELGGRIIPGAIGGVTKAISESNIPSRFYQSAVKLPLSSKWTKILPGKEISQREVATRAGIEAKIRPSAYGAEKVASLERQTRQAVDDIFSSSVTKSGPFISRDEIIDKGLKKAYANATKASDPVKAKEIVDEIANGFRNHPEFIRADDLNAIKRQIWTEIKWGSAESTQLRSQLVPDAKKGIGHAAKEALEEIYPDLKEINAKDGAYIALKEAIERAAGRIRNRDLIGLDTKVLFLPHLWPAAIVNATIGHPQVKSQLAFTLNKIQRIKGTAIGRPVAYEAFAEEGP